MHFAKTYLALALVPELLFIITFSETIACIEQADSCQKDYECCGFGTVNGVVCQTRRGYLGPRCHIFRRHGENCNYDDECR